MKYKAIFGFFFILAFWMHGTYAQKNVNQEIDLWVEKSKASLNKPDSLLFYAEKAYQLAQKTDYLKGKANSAKMLGVSYFINSDIDRSIKYYTLSLASFEQLNDTLEMGKIYLNLATSYNAKQRYTETVNNAMFALKRFKQNKDLNGEGRVYNLLAIVYANQNEHRKALNYLISYKQLATAVGDSLEMANSFNNIGHTYMKLKLADSAFQHLFLAEKIGIKLGSYKVIGAAYHNLGELYLEKGSTDKSILYYKKALANHIEASNSRLEGAAYLELGKIYLQKKDDIEAERYLNKSLKIAEALNDHELLYYSYWNIARIQSAVGKLKLANANLLLAAKYKDSLNSAQNSETVKQLQIKYETETQEQKLSALQQQNTIQKLEIDQRNLMLSIFGIVLVMLSLLSYFIYYKRKQKEKNLMLEADLATHKLKLDAETKLNTEKLRIARDLHDNIGSYLTFIKGSMDSMSYADANDDKIHQLQNLTAETIRELRKTVWLINKTQISVEEFSVKLGEFFKHINLLSINTNGDLQARLSAQQATDVFRIIQEAVNNAIKHSGATQITINISNDTEILTVLVKDNGNGFDTEVSNEGFGIENMQIRAKQLSASLITKSSKQNGTCVELTIPHIKS